MGRAALNVARRLLLFTPHPQMEDKTMVIKRFMLLILTIVSPVTWATLELGEVRQDEQRANTAVLLTNGIYMTGATVDLIPSAVILNGETQKNTTSATVRVEANEPLLVEMRGENAIVTLLLSEKEIGTVPEKLILSSRELQRSALRFQMVGDEKTLLQKYSAYANEQTAYNDDTFDLFGGGAAASSDGSYGLGRGRRGRGRGRMHYMGSTGCVAYVKNAIGWSGPLGNGVAVTGTLKRHGWGRVSCSSPPSGAVASWSGGFHGKGHTAIWTGSCWAYDMACADPGSHYRLFECVARN